MARSNKVNLPSSGAGITRYFEDYKSKIEFNPGHIIVLAVIVVLLVMILHIFGLQIINVI
ncbi:MAG: preprotein translocase subunit Sec61beta [Nanoarchaeota archaeon]|nr:preprotein translocase subunit Sec61beta [Nanoarchaeota archaeon]